MLRKPRVLAPLFKPRRWQRIKLRNGALWGLVAGSGLTLLAIAGEPGGLDKPLGYFVGYASGLCGVTVLASVWMVSLRNRIVGARREPFPR